MWPRRLAFLTVATLVLWYLAHFGLNALMLAAGIDPPAPWGRVSDLALVPLCAAVSWWTMRHLERQRSS